MTPEDRFAEHTFQEWMQARQFATEYGRGALRAFTLFNGGALVALLTFLGSVYGGRPNDMQEIASQLFLPFGLFVSGLICTGFATAIAYVNFTAITESTMRPRDIYDWSQGKGFTPNPTVHKIPAVTLWIAVGLCASSAICFMVGSFFTLDAFASPLELDASSPLERP